MTGVKRSDREKLKSEIGNYLVEKTLQDVGSQRSPVTGREFKSLTKKYKDKKKKVASPVPNLELKGDMLDAFKYKKTSSGIEIGIFNTKQAQKADNHNKFSAKSLKTPLPARKFIPKKGRDTYRPEIRKEIASIVDEFKSSENSLGKVAAAILNASKGKSN